MLDRIKASLPSLAPAEQRVGRLVLTDPRAFANLPITELADRSHVSKPTVVRFCRSMGYDGLSDFKLKLAQSLFREFHARCFWHMKPDLIVTAATLPLIIKGLRTHGGRRGVLAAAKLLQ